MGFGAKPQIEIKKYLLPHISSCAVEVGSGVLSRIKIITFPLSLTDLLKKSAIIKEQSSDIVKVHTTKPPRNISERAFLLSVIKSAVIVILLYV